MNQHKYYIPRTDGEFGLFFMNVMQYMGKKCAGTPPPWPHIPKNDQDAFIAAYMAWDKAYTVTTKPHTPPETREKNRIKKASEKLLRDFIKQYLRFPPVTDEDRDNMGIPNYSGTRSTLGRPCERVEFSFRVRGIRQVQLDFRVQGSVNKAKPANYAGAVAVWDILDKAPEQPEDLNHYALASRTPYAIEFNEKERGKTVYVALCWENEKGQRGPWSEVQAAIVP
jgi:hypothetical protein